MSNKVKCNSCKKHIKKYFIHYGGVVICKKCFVKILFKEMKPNTEEVEINLIHRKREINND